MAKIKRTPMMSAGGKLTFGLGDFGFSLVTNTVGSFLMFFGTAVCGISGTLMGLVTAISTAWDAVTDPVVGYMSDHSRSKIFGRRHGFLLIAIFGVALMNVALWNVPVEFPSMGKWAWILACMLCYDVFTTFFATPCSALSVELGGDSDERAKIQSVRSVFQLVGTIVPIVLMSVLQSGEMGQYDVTSYTKMAYITSSCMLIFGMFSYFSSYSSVPRLRAKSPEPKEKEKMSLKKIFSNFFVVIKKPLYKNLILGYMISMMASSFLTMAGLHVLTYTFHLDATNMYTLVAGLFIMTILSQPIWIFIVKKFDKKTAILSGIATTFIGIGFLTVVFLSRASFSEGTLFLNLMGALFLAGAGMGALYSMPTAMMGDAVAVEKARTKIESTGTYTGFMTLANKLSQAGTSLIIGVLLDLIGFNEGSPVQTPSVEAGLGWLIIIGISLALAGGVIFYAKYNLKKEDIPSQDDEFENVVIKENADVSTGKNRADESYIRWE